jgi:hypothetical protein
MDGGKPLGNLVINVGRGPRHGGCRACNEQRQEKNRRVDRSTVSPPRLGGRQQREIPRPFGGDRIQASVRGRSRHCDSFPDVTTRCRRGHARLEPPPARSGGSGVVCQY